MTPKIEKDIRKAAQEYEDSLEHSTNKTFAYGDFIRGATWYDKYLSQRLTNIIKESMDEMVKEFIEKYNTADKPFEIDSYKRGIIDVCKKLRE